MLPSMKRPPVSTPPALSASLPSRWSESIPFGAHEVRHPSIRALEVARRSSPAHGGIRGVGAPSTRRLCDSSQATCRAHPPIEPAQARRGSHASHLGGHPVPGVYPVNMFCSELVVSARARFQRWSVPADVRGVEWSDPGRALPVAHRGVWDREKNQRGRSPRASASERASASTDGEREPIAEVGHERLQVGRGKGFRACPARCRFSGEVCGAEARPGGRLGRGATASSSGRPPGTAAAPPA